MKKARPGYEQIQPGIYRKIPDNRNNEGEQKKSELQEIYREIDQMLDCKPKPRFIKDNGVSTVRRSGIIRAIKLAETNSCDSSNDSGPNLLPTSTPHPKKSDKRFFDRNVSILLSPITQQNNKTIASYPTRRKSRDVAVMSRHSRSLDKFENIGENKRSDDSVIVIGSTLSSHSMSLRRSRRDVPSNCSKLASELSDVQTQTPKSDHKVESKNVKTRIPVRSGSRDNVKTVNAKRSLSEPAKSYTNNEIAPKSFNRTLGGNENENRSGDSEQPVNKTQTVVVFSKVPLNSSSRRVKSPAKPNASRKSLTGARTNSPKSAKASKSKISVREVPSRSKSPKPTTSRSKSPKQTSSKSKTPNLNQSRRVLHEPEMEEQNESCQNNPNIAFERSTARRRYFRVMDKDSSDDDLPTKDTNQEVALSPIGTITSVAAPQQKPPQPTKSNDTGVGSETTVTRSRSRSAQKSTQKETSTRPATKTKSSERVKKSTAQEAQSKATAAESVRNAVPDETAPGKTSKKTTTTDGKLRKQANRNAVLSPVESNHISRQEGTAQIQDTSAQTCRDVGLSPFIFDEESVQHGATNLAAPPKSSHNVAVEPMTTHLNHANACNRSNAKPSKVVQRCSVALSPIAGPSERGTRTVAQDARKTVCQEKETSQLETFLDKLAENPTVNEFVSYVTANNKLVSSVLQNNDSSSGDGTRFVKAAKSYRGPTIFESVREPDTLEELADFSDFNDYSSNENPPWRFESGTKSAGSSNAFGKLKKIFTSKPENSTTNRYSTTRLLVRRNSNESNSDDEVVESQMNEDAQIDLVYQRPQVYTNKSTKKEKVAQVPSENLRQSKKQRVETGSGPESDEFPQPLDKNTSVRSCQRSNNKKTETTNKHMKNTVTSDREIVSCQTEGREVNRQTHTIENAEENRGDVVDSHAGDREVEENCRGARRDKEIGVPLYDPRCNISLEALGRNITINDLCCKGRPHRDNPEDGPLSEDCDEGIEQTDYRTSVFLSKRKAAVPKWREPSLLELDYENRALRKSQFLEALRGTNIATKDANTNTSGDIGANKPTKEVDITNASTQTSATERTPLYRNLSRTSAMKQRKETIPRSFSPNPAGYESSVFLTSVRQNSPFRSRSPVIKSRSPKAPTEAKKIVGKQQALGDNVSNTNRKIVELEDEGCNTITQENTDVASLSTNTTINTNRTQVEQRKSPVRYTEKSPNRIGKNVRHNLFPSPSQHHHEPVFKTPLVPPPRTRSRTQSTSRDRGAAKQQPSGSTRASTKTRDKSAPSSPVKTQNHRPRGGGGSTSRSPLKSSSKEAKVRSPPPPSRGRSRRPIKQSPLRSPSRSEDTTVRNINSPESSVRLEPSAMENAVQDNLISTSTNIEESLPVKKKAGRKPVNKRGTGTASLQAETVTSSTRPRRTPCPRNNMLKPEDIAEMIRELQSGANNVYLHDKKPGMNQSKLSRTSQISKKSTSAVKPNKVQDVASVTRRGRTSKTSVTSRKSRKTVELETVQEERPPTAEPGPSTCNSERELASVDLNVVKKVSKTKSGRVRQTKSTKKMSARSEDLPRVSSEPLFSGRTDSTEELGQEMILTNQPVAGTSDEMLPPPPKRPKGQPRKGPVKEKLVKDLRKVVSENAIICDSKTIRRRKAEEKSNPAPEPNVENEISNAPIYVTGPSFSNANDNGSVPSHNQLILTALQARMSQSQANIDESDGGYVSDLHGTNIRVSRRGPSHYSQISNLEVSEVVEYPKGGISSGYMRLKQGMRKLPAASARHSMVYLVYEGEAIVKYNNQEVFLEKAGTILIPTGVEYEIENRSKETLVLFYVRTQMPY